MGSDVYRCKCICMCAGLAHVRYSKVKLFLQVVINVLSFIIRRQRIHRQVEGLRVRYIVEKIYQVLPQHCRKNDRCSSRKRVLASQCCCLSLVKIEERVELVLPQCICE